MVTTLQPPETKPPGAEALDNKRHEKLAHLIASCPEISATKLYQKVYRGCTPRAAASEASKFLKNPNSLNRIIYLRRPREKAEEQEVYMTIDFKRKFLKEIVETPVGKVNENSRVCQRVQFTTTTTSGEVLEEGDDEEDEPVRKDEIKTTKTVWMPDKLKAIELDSKLSGELTPKSEEGTIGAGIQIFIQNLVNGTLKPAEALVLEVGDHHSVKQVKGKIVK